MPCWAQLIVGLATSHDVTVFPLRRPSGQHRYRAFGADVVPGPMGDLRLRYSPILWAEAARRITAEAAASPFDLVHSLAANEAGFVGALAAFRLRCPLVAHVNGGELAAIPEIGYGSEVVPSERLQVRLTLKRATVVTAGSRETERRLARRGVRRPRWSPYGVDTARFFPGDRNAGARRRVLCVADLNPVKGHAHLLGGFARLAAKRPDVDLHLVGAGPELGRLRRAARADGLDGRIHWWGAIPNTALGEVYRTSDAFALTSLHEAQGVVLGEAAAAGLPIVATPVGMAHELPPAGAKLVSSREPEELAAALAWALEASERRAPGTALRQWAEEKLSLARALARTEAVYSEALHARG